jgi:hypothetical protein
MYMNSIQTVVKVKELHNIILLERIHSKYNNIINNDNDIYEALILDNSKNSLTATTICEEEDFNGLFSYQKHKQTINENKN